MRRIMTSRLALFAGAALALPALFACIEHPLKAVEYDKASELQNELQLEINKDVDILFVIDNSGSMAQEQANLAANFDSFIGVLEADDVKANYRIGLTTTDNGNVECSGTSPEGGTLRLSSCRGRLDEFVWPKQNPTVDAQDVACTDICSLEASELDALMKPTTTDVDDNSEVRPWLENIEGLTNLPDGVSTIDAFRCFGPQGVDGCGFEAQLESMYKALQRTQNANEGSYGFLRDSAILSIIIVTDEVDCSANEDHQALVFDRDDSNRVFWEDMGAPVPTSAICWNAGVKCEGSGGTFSSCESQDYDVNGAEIGAGAAEGDAVLRPVSRYVGLVRGFEQAKQEINPDQEVIVSMIAGVPASGPISYGDSTDPTEQDNFGIGPGCTSSVGGEAQVAYPPVRQRDFAAEFAGNYDPNDPASKLTLDNMFSICSADYSPALQAIADKIRDQIKPACYRECVKDVDPLQDGVQPDCIVEQNIPTVGKEQIEECNADGSVPDGETVCFEYLTGAERDPVCVMDGFNLEFRINRLEGNPVPGGTAISATCQLSDVPEVECQPGQ